MKARRYCLLFLFTAIAEVSSFGQSTHLDTARGDRLIADYFRAETERISANSLAISKSAESWKACRQEMRRQLFDMFGLDPLPERNDLKPVVTGTTEKDGILVENLHFQSLPGLYVTGNLYRPKE